MRQATCRLLILAVLAALAPGCNRGSELTTYPVAGSVSYQGKPLTSGSIVFVPSRNDPAGGPVLSVDIKDGRFEGQITAGKKSVEIHASFPTGKMGTYEDGTKFEETDGLPEKYNTASELEITIEPSENNNVNFDLK